MSTTTIACPSCGRTQHLEEEVSRTAVVCPECGDSFDASTPPAAPKPQLGSAWSVAPSAKPGPPAVAGAEPPREERQEPEGQEDERPWERQAGPEVRRDCESHRGTLILVLGILGMVFPVPPFGLILSIIALLMGRTDLKKIENGAMDPEGKGTTLAGWICGIIGTIWQSIYLIAVLAWVGLMMFMYFALIQTMKPATPAPPPMAPPPPPPAQKKAANVPELRDYLPRA